MLSTTLLPTALLAASAFASPLRRDVGPDGVLTEMTVVTDIVYISAGASEPFSTSLGAESAAATSSTILPSISVPATSSAPSSSSSSNSTLSAATSTATTSLPSATPSTTLPAVLPTVSAGAPACPSPLTVGLDGQPILINLLGGLTLGGCTFTSTVTSNPLTLISDSSLLAAASTTAPSGAGQGSTAVFQPYFTAVSSAAVTTTLSGGASGTATLTSESVQLLFGTASAFASMASSLTKITAAPTFGASLTALGVLETASASLGEAQVSALSLIQ